MSCWFSRDGLRCGPGALAGASSRPATGAQDGLQGRLPASAPPSHRSSSPRVTRRARALVKAQFNAIAPENVLKWEAVHPQPGRVQLRHHADQYVASASATACSSSATRSCGTARRRAGCSRTPTAIRSRATRCSRACATTSSTVVGRYKGRIDGWDVVNEALNEDGTLRQSPWLQDHRRRLHRQGVPVRARSRPGRGALLQRLQPRDARQARRRRRARQEPARAGHHVTAIGIAGPPQDGLAVGRRPTTRRSPRSPRWACT